MNTQSESNTRLRGRWLILARVAWVALALLIMGLYVAGLPANFEHRHTLCAQALCEDGRLTPEHAQALQGLGLSVDFYAAYTIALDAVFAAVYFAVATVIFTRKSADWLGLFVALTLVTFGLATFPVSLEPLAAAHPIWWLPVQFVIWIGSVSILVFFYLFPNGQFVPRWTRWLAILWSVKEVPHYFFPDSPLSSNTWPPLLSGLVFTGFVGSGLFAQLYRYRWVSDLVQRQQTKWVVFGVAVGLGGLLGLGWLVTILPSLEQNLLVWLAVNSAFPLFILLIPLSIGIAILRYRLWDIDVIIRRTLIYSALTATLAVIYFGSVVLLQSLFRAVTGQQQPEIVTVISTLTIAALFTPLRRRVQDVIDRRFYRRKYDAAQTLAAFGATARDEVDLDKLTARLVQVVEDTLQPESVSVWLNPSLHSPSRSRRVGRAGDGG